MFRIETRAASRSAVCAVCIATAALLSACGSEDKAGRQPFGAGGATAGAAAEAPSAMNATLPPGPVLSGEAKVALDAGNTAYRAKKFAEAIAQYRAAAAASPEHAAPWFGVYMAANELKDKALADSAMAKVNALSADAAELNSHAAIAAGSGGAAAPALPPAAPGTTLPPGHPTTSKPAAPRP